MAEHDDFLFEFEEQPRRKKQKQQKEPSGAKRVAPAVLEESDDGEDALAPAAFLEEDDAAPGLEAEEAEEAEVAAEAAAPKPAAAAAKAPRAAKAAKGPLAAPATGEAWAAWLEALAPGRATGLAARRAAYTGTADAIVGARVRRRSGARPPRGIDAIVVCASAKRAADVAKVLRSHAAVSDVCKLFGKHFKATEQAALLRDATKALPRVAVATPARLEVLLPAVPWADHATLFVDSNPDAKDYTPFTLPDAKHALARVVAALLAKTAVSFATLDGGARERTK